MLRDLCRCWLASLTVVFLTFNSAAQAAPATYLLYEAVEGANRLNGSITVDDIDGDHKIAPAEIVGWAFTAIGPVAFNITSGAGNASIICSVAGGVPCLTVVGTELFFDFDSISSSNGPSISFANGASQVQFQTRGTSGGACNPTDCGQIDWFTATTFAALDSPTRAVALLTTAVPEPSGLGLMVVALAGLGATVRRTKQ